MTIGGVMLLALSVLCIGLVCKGESGEIRIRGSIGAAVTCITIGAVGLWAVFQIFSFSLPFFILCLAFLAAGIVIGVVGFKRGDIATQVWFTGLAAVAVVSGLIGMAMLFIW